MSISVKDFVEFQPQAEPASTTNTARMWFDETTRKLRVCEDGYVHENLKTPGDFRIVATRTNRGEIADTGLQIPGMLCLVTGDHGGAALYRATGFTSDDWVPVEFGRPDYIGQNLSPIPTIYVSLTGNDGYGDGSASNPYRTLPRASLDLPSMIETTVDIQLSAGLHDAAAFEGEGATFDASRFSSRTFFDYGGSNNWPRIRIRGSGTEFSRTVNDGYLVSSGLDADIVTVYTLNSSVGAVSTSNTYIEFDGGGGFIVRQPVIGSFGNSISVVGGNWFVDDSFTARIVSPTTDLANATFIGSLLLTLEISMVRLNGGFHTAYNCTLSGVTHQDGQIFGKNTTMTGMHVNVAGFPGSEAANAFIDDGLIDTVQFNSDGQYNASGEIIQFTYIRHHIAIDQKFRFRNASIQEISNFPLSFDGAGVAILLQHSFMEGRCKVRLGTTLTTYIIADNGSTFKKRLGAINSPNGAMAGPCAVVGAGGQIHDLADFANTVATTPAGANMRFGGEGTGEADKTWAQLLASDGFFHTGLGASGS